MGIKDSADVADKKSTFSVLVTGGTEEDRVIPIGKPYGVAARNGKLYVCDTGLSIVEIIDFKGKKFDKLKGDKSTGKLKKPINLTLDAEGNLYVADTSRKEILMYDAEGNFIRTYGKELNMKPVDVAVDSESVYVLDMGANEIKVINRKDGELARSFGKEALSIPTNMTVDSNGFLYVSNIGHGNVTKFDRDGHVISTFGKLGDAFGEFGRPKGVAVDSNGRLYVTDAMFYNTQIFSSNGRLLMFFGDPGLPTGSLNLPAGITVTRENMDYFQKMAAPGFILEEIIIIANQYGDAKISIYGLGHKEGSPTTKEEEAALQKAAAEAKEKEKNKEKDKGKDKGKDKDKEGQEKK